MFSTIFQIATFGTVCADNVLIGLRTYPPKRLVLMCYDYDGTNAKRFLKAIRSVDENIEVIICLISRQNIIENVFGHIGRVVGSQSETNRFQRILVNLSAGDKSLSYAVLSAAYIKGIETFVINSNFSNRLTGIPIPKSYYDKVITKADLRILNSIARAGGVVYGLDQLQRLSGLIKPLLSYHINGRANTKGLIDLGLIWVENKRIRNGTIAIVRLTAMGKLFITI
jgi:hypothetical protein